MIAVNNESGCWPTQIQELLLRAALLTGDDALQSWQAWKRQVNIDVLDYGSHRMIPQLYRNLREHDVEDPWLDRFKGVYRYYLYQNQMMFHRIAPVLAGLSDAGIPTLALKGCAMVHYYYRDSGLRPMQDADILVPARHAPAAMAVLNRLKWNSIFYSRPEERIPIQHSTPFENGAKQQIDLHWHLFWECFNAHNDKDYWEGAVSIKVGETPTLALNPTDQLLHTCWHGARWNEVPPIRWIADASAILSVSAGQIDWQDLVLKARRHHISLPLRDSLRYLRQLLAAPIPDSVIEELAATPTTRIEQDGYAALLNPTEPPSTLKILKLLYYDYLWLKSSTTLRPKWLAYVKFLKAKWNIRRLWQVPFYISFKIVRRGLMRIVRRNRRQIGSVRGTQRQ